MISVSTVYPKAYYEWHCNGVYVDAWLVNGTFVFGIGDDPEHQSETFEFDVGYILNKPSPVQGENYCFQYEANGSLIWATDWYTVNSKAQGSQNVTVKGFSRRVNCACAMIWGGTHTEDYSSSDFEAKWVSYWSGTRKGWWEKRLKSISFRHDTDGRSPSQKTQTFLELTAHIQWICHPLQGDPYPNYESISVTRTQLVDALPKYWVGRGSITGTRTLTRSRFPSWLWDCLHAEQSTLWGILVQKSESLHPIGNLTAEAAKSIRALDINTLAYAKDFTEIFSLAKSLVSLAELDPEGIVKNVPKAVASTYLAEHYGLRLTVKDTQEIANSIAKATPEKYLTQRMGASEKFEFPMPGRNDIVVSCSQRLTAVIDSMSKEDNTICSSFKKVDRALYELDLAPTAANIWDMVPFSFVVDWFLPIGDALEKKEVANYAASLSVRKAFYSKKFTWSETRDEFLSDGSTIAGTVNFKFYQRNCQSDLVIPSMDVERPKGFDGHLIEAAALLISAKN